MCGIWASIGLPGDGAADRAGLSAAASRGPDGEALLTLETPAGRLALGHRRLSIYDLDARAAQPMRVGPLTGLFNGSLYNFASVRAELEALGIAFATMGDCEVLLQAWLRWGPQAMARFDGMFAALIHDARDQCLHLVRDRFGEKPLHVLEHPGGARAIASEIRQFTAAGLLDQARIDAEVLTRFLALSTAEAGTETFVRGVRRLLPGTHETWDLSGPQAVVRPAAALFAGFSRPDPALADPRVAAEALRSALLEAVSNRLIADVQVGACLSGGLDSSTIVRMSAGLLPSGSRIASFCAVFDEIDTGGRDLSERAFALAAAEHPGIELQFVTPHDQAVADAMLDVVRLQGEPFAHTSILAQHFVFKAARAAGVVAMLDGQGADELFGGYTGMLGHALADILLEQGPGAWRRAARALADLSGEADTAGLRRATINAILPERLRRAISRTRGRWPDPWQLTRAEPPLAEPRQPDLGHLDSLVRELVTNASLPGLLRYEDRNAMAVAIETRLPFLAAPVADLAMRMPFAVKVRGGWTKAVLRDAAEGIVPDMIVRRRQKLGFVSPHDRWMAGPLHDWALSGVALAQERFGGLLADGIVGRLQQQIGRDPVANSAGFRLACAGHWAAEMGLVC
jgi:asparagine synthase (glutamine-hydrolysing)